MQKLLESESDMHIIARASNLNELESFINSGIPDVLIVDTVTPNLDVSKLITSIREKNVRTQVLLLLHTPDHQLVVDSLSLGVKGFITKKSKSSKLGSGNTFSSKGRNIWRRKNHESDNCKLSYEER